jgi:hypothetical protein
MEEGRGPLLRWKDAGGALYEPDRAAAAVYREMLPFYLRVYELLKGPMREADRWRSVPPQARND